jgi:hypothetical protein
MALGVEPRLGVPRPQFAGQTFALVACDWTTPLAMIDVYESATFVARYNEVSTFEVVMPADTPAARVLLESKRPRVLLYANAAVYRSGPLVRIDREADADGAETLTLSGTDDLVWLRRRLAHPQPGTTSPPFSTSAYDARTGSASQVIAGYVDRNAGPGAVAARQVPGLTVPTPAPFGPVVSTSARYQTLLEFIQGIATAAGVGFRVRNLVFEVFAPSGRAVFSTDLGTLAGYSAVVEAPDLTWVYVAGQGEGTAREIREYANWSGQEAWGRIEGFVDRRDTAVAAELDQAGAEALAGADRPPVIDMQAVDTVSQSFLVDWNVGDLAVVRIGDESITDVIAEASIEMEPNAPPIIRPVLGGAAVELAQWRRVAANDRRIRQLERR